MTIDISENMRMTATMLSKLTEAFDFAKLFLCSESDQSPASNDILLQLVESRSKNNEDFRQKLDSLFSRSLPEKTKESNLLPSSVSVKGQFSEVALDNEQEQVYNIIASQDEYGHTTEMSARDIAKALNWKTNKVSPILQTLKSLGKIESNRRRGLGGRWWVV